MPAADDALTRALTRAGIEGVTTALANAVVAELQVAGFMIVKTDLLAALQEKAAKAAHIV